MFAPIIFGEDQNNAPIHHWVPDNDKDKVTPYKKFSVKIDLLKYSEIEYDQYLKVRRIMDLRNNGNKF